MKKLFSIVCLLIFVGTFSLNAKGNLRAANWCFGHGGQITFKSGSPVELGLSSVSTYEGVATISDNNGDLLFYTDGMQVWDKNHNRMPNGWGLYGHSSSSQSGVIVPYPGNSNMFYIFTVDAIWESKDYNKGFRYSIVDLTKNNGFGDVVTKNQLLFAPSCEKITAVGHINGRDIWVLGQRWQDNKICVYLVDKSGIHFQNEYDIKALVQFTNTAWTKGYMKFSQKGDLLAVANNNVSLAIYDFDIQTGVLSNERFTTDQYFKNAYGVEFSPNSKYLYVSATPYDGNLSYDRHDYSYLLQVDLDKAKTSSIEESYNKLAEYTYFNSNTEAYMGALQLALDSKIYFSTVARVNGMNQQSDYLSVINNPDSENCNYVFKGFKLNKPTAFLGLPSFIQSFFRPEISKYVTSDFCDGDPLVFHSDYYAGYKYHWEGSNGFVSDTCDTVIAHPGIWYSGTYKLFVTDTFGFTDTSQFIVNYHKTDITTNLKDTIPDKFIHGNYEKELIISNNNSEAVSVDSLYIKSWKKYTLENIQTPFTIYGNEIRKYKITIDSKVSGSFRDTIILSINQPCAHYEKIALADSIGKITLHIVLPDTTVKLGETFLSDIKAYLEPKTGNKYTFDLGFTYSYISYIYSTSKFQKYAYTKEINGNKELYTLQFPQIVINDSLKTLTSVRGTTLLCDEYMTPLEFTDVTLADTAFNLVLHNGKIQVLRDDCSKDIFQIQSTNLHVSYSQPTPLIGGGKIFLFSPDKGPLKLTIYSLFGEKIEEYNFVSNGKFSYELEPNLNKYVNGLYLTQWESSSNIYRNSIIINK